MPALEENMKIFRSIKLELALVLFLTCFLCIADTFLKVPLCRQAKDYTCGVAALQCIMAYFGDDVRQDVIEKKVKSRKSVGTIYTNIQKFAQEKGYDVEVKNNMTLDELKGFLDRGKPVFLEIQAWADPPFTNPLTQYANDYKDGHDVVAIGYDSASIYFMDPSTLGNYTFIPTDEFLVRWHEQETRKIRLINFGMVITKGQPVYNPSEIKKME